jgi:ribosomal subunit interface protein
MKLADIVSGAGLAVYAEVALVLFLAAFTAVLFQVISRKHANEWQRTGALPLIDSDDWIAPGTSSAPVSRMQVPIQITFRGMDSSDAIESAIRERAARLERFHERIVRCHVVVDLPHKHQRKGHHFEVRIDITTPTGEIVVSRDPHQDPTHEDFRAVIRDAFEAAQRQLEDESRRHRGDVKTHSAAQ